MFASQDNRWCYAAGAALALAGLALLWMGGGEEPRASVAREAPAARVAPVARDPDLEVQLIVHGRLPATGPGTASASVSAPVTAGTGEERGSEPPSGSPAWTDPPSPAAGTLGERPQPPTRGPGRPEPGAARLRKGRVPALREPDPPAGRISDRTLRSILGRRQGALEACYHVARATDPTLEGELTFALTVQPTGAVQVELLDRSPALEQAGVAACIRRKLEALDFTATPPEGGEVHVRLPMSFLRVPEPAADSDA